MAAIIIPTFGGEVPRTTPRLLGQTQAAIAVNCNLGRGSLKPLKGPKKIEDRPESSKTIFKHRHCGWLHWANVCNVVKSAVYDYSDEEPLGHLFIAGDKEYPTQYLACDKVYRLGLPRPEAAPKVEIVEGVGTDEGRGTPPANMANQGLLNMKDGKWGGSQVSIATPTKPGIFMPGDGLIIGLNGKLELS